VYLDDWTVDGVRVGFGEAASPSNAVSYCSAYGTTTYLGFAAYSGTSAYVRRFTKSILSAAAAPNPIYSAWTGNCLSTDSATYEGPPLANNAHSTIMEIDWTNVVYSGAREWILVIGQRWFGTEHWLWNGDDTIQFGAWTCATCNVAFTQFRTYDITTCNILATTYSTEGLYKLYCNGREVGSQPNYFDITDNRLLIGLPGYDNPSNPNSSPPADTNQFFSGCIKSLEIYDVALSSDFVASYRQHTPLPTSVGHVDGSRSSGGADVGVVVGGVVGAVLMLAVGALWFYRRSKGSETKPSGVNSPPAPLTPLKARPEEEATVLSVAPEAEQLPPPPAKGWFAAPEPESAAAALAAEETRSETSVEQPPQSPAKSWFWRAEPEGEPTAPDPEPDAPEAEEAERPPPLSPFSRLRAERERELAPLPEFEPEPEA